MPNSQISLLAQEAIALAQRASDPVARENLIRAAQNLQHVAEDIVNQPKRDHSDSAPSAEGTNAAEI
jgi:hypothetical protein